MRGVFNVTRRSVWKNYWFLCVLLIGIIAGCIVGAAWPATFDADGSMATKGATILEPLGTVFINMMFCVVVPLVFSSVAGAIGNMKSRARGGKVIGVTIVTFVVTGAIAAVIMIILMKIFPPVLKPWADVAAGEVGEQASLATLIVNFFTVSDFSGLLSRRAMLPLIVFSVIFGFCVNACGGEKTAVGKFLTSLTEVMLKFVKIISYYAPIAFFGFFAYLVAYYGPQLISDYGRGMAVYYPLCLAYVLIAFPLYARFGGGRGGAKEMFRHILKPAAVALGTCSSVATIPTNMEAAEETGISKDVSDIVLPLGATMHMDGSSFSCVLKIAFLFGVFGIPFDGVGTFIKVVLVALLSSVAMSGIPGGGYIGEYILCAIFFPDKIALAYPIAITIGNLVDPPATMINAAGDYVVSFIVSRFVDGRGWFKKQLAKK